MKQYIFSAVFIGFVLVAGCGSPAPSGLNANDPNGANKNAPMMTQKPPPTPPPNFGTSADNPSPDSAGIAVRAGQAGTR